MILEIDSLIMYQPKVQNPYQMPYSFSFFFKSTKAQLACLIKELDHLFIYRNYQLFNSIQPHPKYTHTAYEVS